MKSGIGIVKMSFFVFMNKTVVYNTLPAPERTCIWILNQGMVTQYVEDMCQDHTREREMKILEAVADLIILQLRRCELRDGPLGRSEDTRITQRVNVLATG